MTTTLQNTIKYFAVAETVIFASWYLSFEWFLNLQVGFLSALFIVLGAMYSYSRLVKRKVAEYEAKHEKDPLERIDDPYDLYDDNEDTAVQEEVDFKEIVAEEKARIKKSGAAKNLKTSSPALFSFYRLMPYVVLIAGFIALKNNEVLMLWPYMLGLTAGIVLAFFVGKALFSGRSSEY